MQETSKNPRRGFIKYLAGLTGFSVLSAVSGTAQRSQIKPSQQPQEMTPRIVPAYACLQNYKSLKQSSYDRSGGDFDSWRIEPGATKEILAVDGPGMISHIWFTIMPEGWFPHPLKHTVLRIYWDGNAKPSVEVPIGDFFGLTLDEYVAYQSAFTTCSSVKALNSYFAMPFKRSARITVTNEADTPIVALYSNIDYMMFPAPPDDLMYFHAQYRQKTPNTALKMPNPGHNISGAPNLLGEGNYVMLETRGRGHLLGVALGVLENSDGWWGEGDEMVFVDDEAKPVINGTGSEDYFNGAWDFGGFDGIVPFANLYHGAPLIMNPERAGGRYCLYRWHADNPITFTRYLKHTIEHGAANDRGDNFYSVAYWYQTEPYTDFPLLPPAKDRVLRIQPPRS